MSCRLYPPLSPLWLGLTAFLTSRSWSPSRSRFGCWTHTCSFPRSFLVQSLADFAAGLVTDLLLCPVRALRLFLLRSRSLSLGRHLLFVSPRRPSRATLMTAVSFFLGRSFLPRGQLDLTLDPSGLQKSAACPRLSLSTVSGWFPLSLHRPLEPPVRCYQFWIARHPTRI